MNKLAIGTANFGLAYGINNKSGKLTEEGINNVLITGKKEGIEVIDTARAYGDAEHILGKRLEKLKLKYDIITKLNPLFGENIGILFDNSYETLKVEQIYGVLYHNFEYFKKNAESIELLEQRKVNNKVLKIGFSLYYPEELEFLFNRNVSFDLLQIPYNIFDRRFEYLFPEIKKRKIELHVRSVFLQGLFFKKPSELSVFFNEAKDKLAELRKIVDNYRVSIVSLCLNFVAGNNFVDRVVIGVDSAEHLQKNCDEIQGVNFTSEIYDKIKYLRVDNKKIILPFNWK